MLAHCTHDTLIEQYFDRLASRWQRRERMLDSHVQDFAKLYAMDNELQQTVRALLLLKITPKLLQQRLADPIRSGEMFAIAWCAIAINDQAAIQACIGFVQAMPSLRNAFAAAMQWATPQQVWGTLGFWHELNGKKIANNRDAQPAAITDLANTYTAVACKYHDWIWERLKPNPWWQELLSTKQSTAMHLALLDCAIHVSGLEEAFIPIAQAGLNAQLHQLSRLSAEVLLLRTHAARRTPIGEQALQILTNQAQGTSPNQEAVQALAVLRPWQWDTVLAGLAKNTDQQRIYLQALAWCGHRQGIPILIEHLDHPRHARIAGAALSMLTGSLPARDGWLLSPSHQLSRPTDDRQTGSEIPPRKIDVDLPLPDKAAFKRWWLTNAQRFDASSHWLAGLPISTTNLHQVLRNGQMTWREMAAYHLQAQNGGPRFAAYAPSTLQLAWLKAHELQPQ